MSGLEGLDNDAIRCEEPQLRISMFESGPENAKGNSERQRHILLLKTESVLTCRVKCNGDEIERMRDEASQKLGTVSYHELMSDQPREFTLDKKFSTTLLTYTDKNGQCYLVGSSKDEAD